MIKASLKFILSLLLLAGYGQTSAQIQGDLALPSLTENPTALKSCGLTPVESDQTFINNSSSSRARKENHQLEVSVVEYEEERDRSISVNKYSTNGNQAIEIDEDLLFGHSLHIHKDLQFCKHSSYSSTQKYILFREFRI